MKECVSFDEFIRDVDNENVDQIEIKAVERVPKRESDVVNHRIVLKGGRFKFTAYTGECIVSDRAIEIGNLGKRPENVLREYRELLLSKLSDVSRKLLESYKYLRFCQMQGCNTRLKKVGPRHYVCTGVAGHQYHEYGGVLHYYGPKPTPE